MQRVFDQVPLLVAAMEGPDMTLTAATALYRQFVGRPMDGRPVREAFPEVTGQQVFQMFDRVCENGQPESVHEFQLQMDVPGTGPVEVFLDFTILPLRVPDGEIAGVIADNDPDDPA